MTDHNQLDIDILNAWTEASKDLGIKIQAPFSLKIDKEQTIESLLLVENFGSKLGTLVFTDTNWLTMEKLSSSGFGISTLGESQRNYNRDLFIDMLNDWGYCGDLKSKPNWYTGQYGGQEN